MRMENAVITPQRLNETDPLENAVQRLAKTARAADLHVAGGLLDAVRDAMAARRLAMLTET